MQIGQLANATGFSVETIRFYEKSGILLPAQRHKLNNYRMYGEEHLQRLRFVRNCRALGMKLDEIRELLGSIQTQKDCHIINSVVAQHLKHVQNKIKKLKELEKELKVLQSKCKRIKQTEECEILHELYSIYGAAKNSTPASTPVHGTEVCAD